MLAKPRLKAAATRWLHLHALAVLAIAQPLFDQLGRNPTFFVAHRASTTTVWLLTLGLFLVPGLILAAITLAVAAMHRRAGEILHGLVIGALAGAVLLPAFSRLFDQRTTPSILAALMVAIAAAMLYLRFAPTRTFVSYMGVFTVAILGLFVFASDAGDLFFPSEVSATGLGGNDTSVVVVVFDELPLASLVTPELVLDRTRAPHLVDFANRSTWYSDTTTVSPRTQWAVPSILAGVRATQDSIPTAAQFPQNLFTVTGESHDHLVAETITRLCPDAVCGDRAIADVVDDPGSIVDDVRILYLHTLLPNGLAERWLPPITNGWTGFATTVQADPESDDSDSAETGQYETEEAAGESFDWLTADLGQNQRARFVGFAEAVGDNQGPTVSYAHVLLPHAPWSYLPDGTVYNGDRIPGLRSGIETWSDNQALLDQATHRYLLQLRFTDRLFGDVIAQLEATGQYDDAMIIVTADHGTSFTPGTNRREAEPATLADVAVVPLFIKYPGQDDGAIDPAPVQTIDIFPTIAEVLDIDLDSQVDGASLLDPDRPTVERTMMRTGSVDDFEQTLDMATAIERIVEVVPNGVDAEEVWGTRSTRDLMGARVDDTARNTTVLDVAAPFEIRPLNAAAYDDVTPSGPFVPLRYLGSVDSDDASAEAATVVVAVNGTIAGASEVVDGSLSVLLDPRTFVAGANTIEVFSPTSDGLTPISAVEVEPFIPTFDDRGRLVTVTQGDRTWAPSTDGRYVGFAGIPAEDGSGRTPPIRGWAADRELGAPAEHVLVIGAGNVLLDHPERTQRSDVVANTGDERLLESGWNFELTPAQLAADPFAVALFPDGSFHAMRNVNAEAD